MPGLVVVGAQWGDEGKGKLVDYLTSNADLVVRFQGGNNAGHTLVVAGIKTKLNLVPSGILRPEARCLIAAGVVLNPTVLWQEIETLRLAGVKVDPSRLIVDRDAQLILDYHQLIDQAREERMGQSKIGTTGRGIGPAYEDRAGRCGIRLAELADLTQLKKKLVDIIAQRNLYLSAVLGSDKQVDFDTLWNTIQSAERQVLPFIGNGSLILDSALKQGKKVVFEGAQGTLLDQTFGTVPFVTSSNTLAGAVTTGCGVGPRSIDYILGVAKAYSTRVGSGPFPTELTNEFGEKLRQQGQEFGTVTGRPRRCGWLDLPLLRRAIRLNGINSLVLTKLDVLTGFEKIKICVGYQLDHKELEDLPTLMTEFERLEPQYIELDGWSESLEEISSFEDLPKAARNYVTTVSELTNCQIEMVSVGPDRKQTFCLSENKLIKSFLG